MASRLRIRIPASDHKGLATLLRLSDVTMQAVIAAISATSPELSRTAYASHVVSKVSPIPDGLTEGDLIDAVRVATVLSMTRSSTGMTIPEFADQVIQAMKESKSSELQPSDGDWDKFRQRLTELLGLENSLGVVAKANELQREYERTFHDARVLTDVRPIFRGEPPELTDYAVVMHQLEIVYHEGARIKEFFVPLDAEGIVRLRQLLERAEQKAAQLRSRFGEVSWQVLEGEAE